MGSTLLDQLDQPLEARVVGRDRPRDLTPTTVTMTVRSGAGQAAEEPGCSTWITRRS